MNLRILKKLSKRAAPLLEAMGDSREQFKAERWSDYTTSGGHDRKHWDRGNARNPINFHGYVYWPARSGLGHPYMRPPKHPLKGTAMLGWSVGYYEVEYEHDDAWTLLQQAVREHFTDYRELPPVTHEDMEFQDFEMVEVRRFRNPSQILRAVPELIKAHDEELERAKQLSREFFARKQEVSP